MKTSTRVLLMLVYALIAAFLCLAAISDPTLNDSEQWVWCAVAVLWGPLVVLLVLVFG